MDFIANLSPIASQVPAFKGNDPNRKLPKIAKQSNDSVVSICQVNAVFGNISGCKQEEIVTILQI